jgi:hypothetical protein
MTKHAKDIGLAKLRGLQFRGNKLKRQVNESTILGENRSGNNPLNSLDHIPSPSSKQSQFPISTIMIYVARPDLLHPSGQSILEVDIVGREEGDFQQSSDVCVSCNPFLQPIL